MQGAITVGLFGGVAFLLVWNVTRRLAAVSMETPVPPDEERQVASRKLPYEFYSFHGRPRVANYLVVVLGLDEEAAIE